MRDAAGTYTGVSARAGVTQVVYISKSIVIQGGYTAAFADPPDPRAHPTKLDAEGQGRAIYITGDVSPALEGLQITNGLTAGDGGGICIIDAHLVISSCWVFSNTAYSSGGGLHLYGSAARLSTNTISFNTAGWGGGLGLFRSDVTLIGNTFTGNTARDSGGGLYLAASDNVMLRENTITANAANGTDLWLDGGGGLYLTGSDATIDGNTITTNTAQTNGGGIELFKSDATLNGNRVTANTATRGGGLYLGGLL
jgi:parallel beta-helix repeat protein